jgi:hypothetical protein
LDLPITQTIQKVGIAAIHYHALFGEQATKISALTNAQLLGSNDAEPLQQPKFIKELSHVGNNYILYHDNQLHKTNQ